MFTDFTLLFPYSKPSDSTLEITTRPASSLQVVLSLLLSISTRVSFLSFCKYLSLSLSLFLHSRAPKRRLFSRTLDLSETDLLTLSFCSFSANLLQSNEETYQPTLLSSWPTLSFKINTATVQKVNESWLQWLLTFKWRRRISSRNQLEKVWLLHLKVVDRASLMRDIDLRWELKEFPTPVLCRIYPKKNGFQILLLLFLDSWSRTLLCILIDRMRRWHGQKKFFFSDSLLIYLMVWHLITAFGDTMKKLWAERKRRSEGQIHPKTRKERKDSDLVGLVKLQT